MFYFNRVLNATTGQQYTIQAARLTGEELNERPDGVNLYEIDLEPDNPEGQTICGVTLAVHNNGYVVQLTRNLDPEGSTRTGYSEELGRVVIQEDVDDAAIKGRTLIVTMKP